MRALALALLAIAAPVLAQPTVQVTSPAPGTQFLAPVSVSITAQASVPATRVEFLANGSIIGTAIAAPYMVVWSNAPLGTHLLQARIVETNGQISLSPPVPIQVTERTSGNVNVPPAVTLTAPAPGTVLTAPANVELAAEAADTDGSVASVDFFLGDTLITTRTAPPYGFTWTGVPAGSYLLTARVTDNLGASVTSAAVPITVRQAVAQLYYIHVDHLNTPRLITNQARQAVWRHDQAEPFGNSPPDENPSDLGTFEFPSRFIGTYSDRESSLLYNWHRYLDPARGQYLQSDPIGLRGGSLSTYVHVANNPLQNVDPDGLKLWLCVRSCCGGVANHAYLYDDDTGKCCGDPGPTIRERDFVQTCKERGPGRDTCWLISSTPGDAPKALNCCNRETRGTFYFPGFDDCQDRTDDCIRELGMAPPNTPQQRRFMRCNSCFRQ